MDKDKLEFNLTEEEWEEVLKKIKIEPFPNSIVSSSLKYRCSLCRDTKRIDVCGGPSRVCSACGPRY